MPAIPPLAEILAPLLAVLLAYLAGSLSFAVIVSRVMGLSDPRTYGSGNPGATNVLRSGSKKAAALTLLLDALKGLVPVLLVRLLVESAHTGEGFGASLGAALGAMLGGAELVALVAVAAFAGHLWPVFFRFKGGKGVATALGVLLGIAPWLGLLVLLVWLAAAALWRYSSLAALLAALSAPLLYLLLGGVLWPAQGPLLAAITLMTALLLWRHAGNISRLVRGQEGKIGKK